MFLLTWVDSSTLMSEQSEVYQFHFFDSVRSNSRNRHFLYHTKYTALLGLLSLPVKSWGKECRLLCENFYFAVVWNASLNKSYWGVIKSVLFQSHRWTIFTFTLLLKVWYYTEFIFKSIHCQYKCTEFAVNVSKSVQKHKTAISLYCTLRSVTVCCCTGQLTEPLVKILYNKNLYNFVVISGKQMFFFVFNGIIDIFVPKES